MEILKNFLRGMAVGMANVIPGVSGGTMALILGIYSRLLGAISKLGPQTVKAVLGGRKAIVEEFKRVDALFLGTLGAGALAAIVVVAKALTWLLENQHDPTYGFFFGLVMLSVVVPYRLIRKKGAATVLSCLLAAVMVVGLTLALSGEEKLASAQKKAAVKEAKIKASAGALSAEEAAKAMDRVPEDPATMAFFFVAGVIAISAMILPGISGSFMLLLMGVYFDVLACVTGRQIVMLGVFSLGCGIGLLFFTRLLNYLLARFHDVTMAFLMGLVVGSLYAIWPFKSFGMAGGKRVDMDNVLPAALGLNELLTLAAVLAGSAIVGVFIWIELKQEQKA